MSRLNPDLLVSPAVGRRPRAHLVGVCGSGMRALAELLLGMGWQVSGSDSGAAERIADSLRKLGGTILSGHAAEHVPVPVDVLVHTPAAAATNPEIRMAAAQGVPCLSYPQMLSELMRGRLGVAISGTHGKSTTAALTGFLLTAGGLDPSVIVGAEPCDGMLAGRAGNGDVFVAESCEYRRAFLQLHPAMIVMLGLEPDHLDCYANLQELEASFLSFAQRLPADGVLFAAADCPATMRIAQAIPNRVVRFSPAGPSDWWADRVEHTSQVLRFAVYHNDRFFCDVRVPLAGRHHVSNVLSAIAVAAEFDVGASQIARTLARYPGLKRRFEYLGTCQGVALIDDYAHHPTAVEATIRAARQRFPRRRIVAAFEPHQMSRTSALFDDFARALSLADLVCLTPLFAARESVARADCEALVHRLADRIEQIGTPATAPSSLDRIIATLDDALEPGDVLLTMGAGHVDRIQHEFTGRLQRHSEAG